MASENKVAKLKNSYCVPGMLKNKASELKLKRTAFYTSADRQELNREAEKLLEEDEVDLNDPSWALCRERKQQKDQKSRRKIELLSNVFYIIAVRS